VEHAHSDHLHEEHGHGDEESLVIRKMAPNEALANELNEHGVIAEHVEIGKHPLESKPYYSHKLSPTPRFVTNRGMIRIRNRNFDLVQVIQKF
jgi:hypothetical protein